MRIKIVILLILTGINLQGQSSKVDILSEKKALRILESQGIDSLEKYTQPINLVYLNETNSKTIIEKEFMKGFIMPHYDSLGIFVYNLPNYSIEIASTYKNMYAAQKIFEYYKSLPKHLKSDTIYNAYFDLDDLLSLLVFYNPKGLGETLESDYYEWEKLAQTTTPKKYKTINEYRQELTTKSFDERLKLKKEDLEVDCNYISFQIAEELNKLGHKDFNKDLLTQLKAKQTYTFIKNYKFPLFYNQNFGEHIFEDSDNVIDLETKYLTLDALVKEPNKLEKLLYQKVENCCNSRLIEILRDDKQKAYVEFSRNNGSDAYIIKLENDKLLIQEVWSIID